MRLVPAILGLTVFASAGLAQQTASTPETRSVIVNVLDRHGVPIRDLTKDNFVARVNGKPVEVLDAQYSVAPRRIVVLLDMSGSMATEKAKWQIGCNAVGGLLSQTPSDVPIAMLTFAGKVRDTVDFGQGRTAIDKWINDGSNRLQPSLKYPEGRTAFYDAILAGLKLFGSSQAGDAIYAITDGGDNASHASASSARTALLQSGTRLFGFILAESLPTPEEREGTDLFVQMVEDSGGYSFGIAGQHRPLGASWDFDYVDDSGNRDKVKAYSRELNVQLQGFWTLRLGPPLLDKQSKLTLGIAEGAGKARKDKDIVLTYPRLLAAAR